MNFKLTAVLGASLCALTTMAEGYQVNTLSARQNGMGHTGVAIPLQSESMFFNPAGMAFMNQKVDFSASFTAIMPKVKATPTGGETYENISEVATPISANLGMKVYDNLSVGIAFYTPYGSIIKWDNNWPGAELNQSVKLSVYTVQPTVAWRPVENVSIGGGVMISWGCVNLHKGLINPSSMDMVLAGLGIPYSFGKTVPASVELDGKSEVTAGVNLGAMWEINKQWTVGASWRSQQTMKVKSGNATVHYANDEARTFLENRLGIIDAANFAASMPAPWVFSIGASYKPTDKWLLAADIQLTGWKAYRTLDIEFAEEQVKPYDQHITKNYKNSFTYKVGAQYSVTNRCDLRLGLMIDTTPVNDMHYNPETPGCTKIAPSAGVSFTPIDHFTINASVLYVQGLNRTGSCSYPDMLLQVPSTFTAEYKVHAWAPSIGATLSF